MYIAPSKFAFVNLWTFVFSYFDRFFGLHLRVDSHESPIIVRSKGQRERNYIRIAKESLYV